MEGRWERDRGRRMRWRGRWERDRGGGEMGEGWGGGEMEGEMGKG